MDNDVGSFKGRLGVQQRVLPAYRVDFFDSLAEVCEEGMGVFAGDVRSEESIPTGKNLGVAKYFHARNFHILNSQSRYYLLWQRGFIDWLEDWKPDVLVVEANPRYLATNKAIRWMHERQKPVIGWGLGVPPIEGRTLLGQISARWRVRGRKRFINQLNAILAYSHKGADEYLSLSKPHQSVFVAINAVAKPPVGELPEKPPSFDGKPKVLFVGRIQTRKRIDNLLNTCASLPESLQPILWIVGDGPARGDLQKLADEIYPSAEFPGRKEGSELAKYFRDADIFVLPGTGGLAVQEAMAYGLPVIVAEGDGTQDDLVRHGNGWLITAADQQELFKALQEALVDPKRLRLMGKRSFKVVQEEININRMVEVFVEAINYVASPTEKNR